MTLHSRRFAWSWPAVFVAGLVLAGCAERPVPRDGPIALRVIDEQDLAAALESHRGKVVLVDFWATWCGPCKAQFPHNVQLLREYGDRGLRVITVSIDEPEEESAVRQFLEENQAVTENFLSRYGGSQEGAERFDLPGYVPYLRVYDRQGVLRRTSDDLKSGRDVERTIRALLEEGA